MGQCTITCTSPAIIIVMNVINIEFQSINLINCVKDHKKVSTHPTLIHIMLHVTRNYRSLEKFTVGYFRVKFVRGKIFSSLGVSNE